jgi:predicted DNA-binding protein
MKPRILLFLAFASTLLSAFGSQAPPVSTTAATDHAIIQRRRIVLTREPAIAKRFPHKKTAAVSYPVVSGLSPVVLRRVRSLFDFKSIFDYSLQEYREDAWLEEFDYVVNHNANSLLDITFTQSGSGAYPDDQSKHLLINLKDGRLVKAADAFITSSQSKLAAKVSTRLQSELKDILKSLSESKSDPEDVSIAREAQEPLQYKIEDLDNFSVGAKGVTFLYDAGYPHAIQAFEPAGRYFFSFAELKAYIKPDGPLGQFIR